MAHLLSFDYGLPCDQLFQRRRHQPPSERRIYVMHTWLQVVPPAATSDAFRRIEWFFFADRRQRHLWLRVTDPCRGLWNSGNCRLVTEFRDSIRDIIDNLSTECCGKIIFTNSSAQLPLRKGSVSSVILKVWLGARLQTDSNYCDTQSQQ